MNPPLPRLSSHTPSVVLAALVVWCGAPAGCSPRASPDAHAAPVPKPTPLEEIAARNRAAIEFGRRTGHWPTHLEPVEQNLPPAP